MVCMASVSLNLSTTTASCPAAENDMAPKLVFSSNNTEMVPRSNIPSVLLFSGVKQWSTATKMVAESGATSSSVRSDCKPLTRGSPYSHVQIHQGAALGAASRAGLQPQHTHTVAPGLRRPSRLQAIKLST